MARDTLHALKALRRTGGLLTLALAVPLLCEAVTITLGWDPYVNQPEVTQATTINVYRRDNAPGTTFVAIGTVPVAATTFTYEADVVGPGYCYVLTAAGAAVESGYSNELCNTVPLPPPGAPMHLRFVPLAP